MTAHLRLLILGVAASAVLAACDRREAATTAPPAPGDQAAATAPTDAQAPMTYESTNQFASVKLTLPEPIKAQPELHKAIYAQATRDLRQFVEGAQADRTEAGGDQGLPPYEKQTDYFAGAETGRLFSLQRRDFDYTGGAHPNTLYSAALWDKTAKRMVTPAELFARGADLSPLDRALCAAINTAKKARDPSAEPLTLGGKDWSCPRASATPFVLTPGTTPGKAGGLTFLIGPYQVGPYAEGAYQIAIPQSAFAQLIASDYAGEFAGQPTRTGDVTPRQS
ncbi:DUF3298 domain-containing protein [Brevundimonas sp. S30B]|uniref:DUF3298 and DUF4163 domain-containing protein n=1 Tax=unclassified Brevundimonas TaxID=2622653 RepID=UPI0010721BB7|nr:MULTISPECIES: DUF3298 and DUF4163 domain-containing protein [unclassified Brevundimonas]QBX38582.1 DUF3298 domain-containing protein [Brevundimonas sp. MF30-B]TFW00468.1 DUF3298 domain-containing protein [Brevundimonas sp. S30B]TFW01885.1 DUF3298 domain-containing protein [Brevundimonas sp. S30B]